MKCEDQDTRIEPATELYLIDYHGGITPAYRRILSQLLSQMTETRKIVHRQQGFIGFLSAIIIALLIDKFYF